MQYFRIIHTTESDSAKMLCEAFCVALLAMALTAIPGQSIHAVAPPTDCHILQYKLDRLYFSCGTEAGIYRHSRFVILNDNSDSTYSGCIEASYPGMSYSNVTDGLFDSLDITSLIAIFESVEIDSVTSIMLGDIDTRCFTLSTLDNSLKSRSNINVIPYESSFEMTLDFELGKLDGFFSFKHYPPTLDSIITRTISAPYYIALVPDPSRSVNTGGFLTASMYYRFDPSLMSMIFPGDRITPLYCLTYHEQPCYRSYPYDPDQGRSLLRYIRNRPRRISIGITHKALKPVAEYFADILSRDRIRTTIITDDKKADIYLIPVPYIPDNETASLRFIYNRLVHDTTEGNSINETLTIIGDYLHTAERTDKPEIKSHYCQLAEISLRDDIGVYPLFKPTIFLTYYDHLTGWTVDSSGVFDLNQLVRYHITDDSTECGQ